MFKRGDFYLFTSVFVVDPISLANEEVNIIKIEDRIEHLHESFSHIHYQNLNRNRSPNICHVVFSIYVISSNFASAALSSIV